MQQEKLLHGREKLLECLRTFQETLQLQNDDPSLKSLIDGELGQLRHSFSQIEEQLEALVIPPDTNSSNKVIMEIRAGTGGDEAGLFAAELTEMYQRFCHHQGYHLQSQSQSEGTGSGLREAVFSIEGPSAWSQLRYEIGVHRVQRVPQTDPQGRIHTSTATVALFKVEPESEGIKKTPLPVIPDRDLRIDTFKSSGPGGQHVNKTNSAVRVTHLPTGLQVAVQEERCQQMNKARAIQILRERLGREEQRRIVEEKQNERHDQIPSADRSEKIRTYNVPQNRITDHRINRTIHDVRGYFEDGGRFAEHFTPLLAQRDRDAMIKQFIITSTNNTP